jgi:outer membrane protein assembly factor BamB
VILGDRVWLTTATDGGRSLRAISLDRATGKILRDVEVFRVTPDTINSKNSHASPTPILEGDRVYVHFGSQGTAALSTTGEILWKTRLPYQHQHGSGGSPVLWKDLLIVSCDGTDTQFVAALDKNTGRVRWRRPRAGYQAYATPLVIRVGDAEQVVSPGAHRAVSYDPATGREIWQVRYGDGFSNVPRPVYAHGLVFICTGFFQPLLMAVRPDGQGDVTESHTAWTARRGVSLTPSPIVVGEQLYMVSDNGVLSCLNARTGEAVWQQRLGGNYSASFVHAAGRLYLQSEEGETHVLEPGPTFRELAANRLDGATLATLAPAGGVIYLRTESSLYAIGGAAAAVRARR